MKSWVGFGGPGVLGVDIFFALIHRFDEWVENNDYLKIPFKL